MSQNVNITEIEAVIKKACTTQGHKRWYARGFSRIPLYGCATKSISPNSHVFKAMVDGRYIVRPWIKESGRQSWYYNLNHPDTIRWCAEMGVNIISD